MLLSVTFKSRDIEHISLCVILMSSLITGNSQHWFFAGTTRMELLLDNAAFQIYILHNFGHIQVI